MDFLLREFDVIVDVPDVHHQNNQREGMKRRHNNLVNPRRSLRMLLPPQRASLGRIWKISPKLR